MKTLVINGSPKKNGQTMTLTNELITKLSGDVEIINVYDYLPLKPCLSCGQCKSKDICSQDDYFSEVLNKINKSDCIILAAPMWFGNISGPLMSFLSRLNILRNGFEVRKDKEHQWNKAGVLIMTTGARWKSMAKSVEATVEFYFKEMDALMLGNIYANKTDFLPSKTNTYALKQCEIVADIVNKWAEKKQAGEVCSYGYSSWNYVRYEE